MSNSIQSIDPTTYQIDLLRQIISWLRMHMITEFESMDSIYASNRNASLDYSCSFSAFGIRYSIRASFRVMIDVDIDSSCEIKPLVDKLDAKQIKDFNPYIPDPEQVASRIQEYADCLELHTLDASFDFESCNSSNKQIRKYKSYTEFADAVAKEICGKIPDQSNIVKQPIMSIRCSKDKTMSYYNAFKSIASKISNPILKTYFDNMSDIPADIQVQKKVQIAILSFEKHTVEMKGKSINVGFITYKPIIL